MQKAAEIIKTEEILSSISEVKFAYIFGSYATQTYDDRSDVDVAIFIDKNANIFDVKLKVHHLLEIKLQRDIDIIALNTIKNFHLLEDIFNQGILIKDSVDDARIMFELNKEHEILDYKVFQKFLDVA